MAKKKIRPNLLGGQQINPQAVRGDMTAADLVDSAFLAYNGRRLREACRLFAEKMLEDDTVVGMSVTGALTPRPRHVVPDSADRAWFRRLDGLHRRQPLPRHPLRSGPQDVSGSRRGR